MIGQDATAAKATLGTATAATGWATFSDQLQDGLSIATMILGGVLTSWLIFKEARSEWYRWKAKKGDKDG